MKNLGKSNKTLLIILIMLISCTQIQPDIELLEGEALLKYLPESDYRLCSLGFKVDTIQYASCVDDIIICTRENRDPFYSVKAFSTNCTYEEMLQIDKNLAEKLRDPKPKIFTEETIEGYRTIIERTEFRDGIPHYKILAKVDENVYVIIDTDMEPQEAIKLYKESTKKQSLDLSEKTRDYLLNISQIWTENYGEGMYGIQIFDDKIIIPGAITNEIVINKTTEEATYYKQITKPDRTYFHKEFWKKEKML